MNEQERLNALTAPLLTWYDIHKRVLPWRGIRDPYRIWVSEIMLQQTRVQAVLEYYARFMAELPDVYALAAVGEERLFKLWEGLGYYSRARNLHRAAQVLVNDCGGEFPHTREELLRLPGVGDYTASAIASIAFGEPEPAVDGNLLRVAARVGGIAEDIMDARVRKRFRAMLTESIDCGRWLIIGDAADGARSIIANAREAADFLICRGKPTPIYDLPCRLMQVPRPGIIS